MNELKAKRITPDGPCDIYLKSEADKVIMAKDKEIAELKTKLLEEREFGLNRAKSADHEIGKMCVEITELKEQIAELKEAQRWRKYSEEKPRSDGYYIICGSSGFRNADRFTECKDGRGMDFSFYSCGVEYWMPMPKIPNELKETK